MLGGKGGGRGGCGGCGMLKSISLLIRGSTRKVLSRKCTTPA